MDSFIVKKVISYRAKKAKLKDPLSLDINSRLHYFDDLPQLKSSKIVFSWFYTANLETLSTCCIRNFKFIVANTAWAERLVLYNDNNTENAFLITIGHELTHKEKDFSSFFTLGKNRKFINWLNEVHADFGAAEKMVNCSKQKLLESIDYKLALKKRDYNHNTHPSWQQRRAYAESGTFGEILIDRIAEDVKCTNRNLIDKVKDYYKSIVLN